jgi:hypothetical protein
MQNSGVGAMHSPCNGYRSSCQLSVPVQEAELSLVTQRSHLASPVRSQELACMNIPS